MDGDTKAVVWIVCGFFAMVAIIFTMGFVYEMVSASNGCG